MIKNQTNWNLRDENYKGKFLFNMKYFVSFSTDSKSMYFMLTILLRDYINGVCVTKFQLAYIHDKTHPSHIFLKVVSWSALYVAVKSRFGTTGGGGL